MGSQLAEQITHSEYFGQFPHCTPGLIFIHYAEQFPGLFNIPIFRFPCPLFLELLLFGHQISWISLLFFLSFPYCFSCLYIICSAYWRIASILFSNMLLNFLPLLLFLLSTTFLSQKFLIISLFHSCSILSLRGYYILFIFKGFLFGGGQFCFLQLAVYCQLLSLYYILQQLSW